MQDFQTQSVQTDPPKKKLWSRLNQDGLYTKSYDEFEKRFSTPESVDGLYQRLNRDGLFTKPKEEFQKQYFPPTVVETPKPVAKQTDMAKAFSYLRSQNPEQKGGAAEMAQAIAKTKPLVQVSAQPSKKLSKNEIEKAATDIITNPDNSSIYTSDDPIGEISRVTDLKNSAITSDPKNWLDVNSNNEVEVNKKVAELASQHLFQNSKDASLFLNEQFKKQGKEVDVFNTPVEQLEAVAPNTMTAKLAIGKLKQRKALDETFSNSYANFEQTAFNLYGVKQDDPEYKKGQSVLSLLNDPEAVQKAQTDPQFNQQYQMASANLYQHYPSVVVTDVRKKLSQARENKEGGNSWLINTPSAETTDKLVDEMVQKGELNSTEELAYKRDIRPTLGNFFTQNLDTPGLLESAYKGLGSGVAGLQKTFRDVDKKLLNIATLGNADALMEDDKSRTNRLLQEQYETVAVEPQTLAHTIFSKTGHLTGYVLPMIATGAVSKALGVGEKTAEALSMGLMFEGENADASRMKFPDDPTKQFLYTGVSTLGDMYLMRLLPTAKAYEGIKSTFRKDVAKVIANFTDKKITADAAKESLFKSFTNLFSDQGLASGAKGIMSLAKENAKVGNIMGGFSAFHSGVDALFGADVNGADAVNEAIQSFKTGFLGSTPLSLLAMKGSAAPKLDGSVVREIAENPEHFAKLSPDPDIQRNITEASRIWSEIKNLDFTDAQKEKFLLKALSEKVLERKAEETTTPVIKKKYDEAIKEAVKDQENIISGKDVAEEHETFLPKEELKKIKPYVETEVKKPEIVELKKTENEPEPIIARSEEINTVNDQGAVGEPDKGVQVINSGSGEGVTEQTVSPADGTAGRPSPKPKAEFDEFRDHILNDIVNVKGSEFDWVVDEIPMQKKDRDRGVKDLKAGKKSKAAMIVQDAIQGMYDNGYLYLNRGRGNQAERIQIPIKEYMAEVSKPLEATEKDITELNTLLGEDAFNKTFDNAIEYAQKAEPTKPIAAVGKTSKPVTRAAAKSIEKIADSKSEPQPVKEVQPEGKVKASDRLRSLSKTIREKGIHEALPSYLKADTGEAKKSGFGGKALDEAAAKAIDIVADAIDAGKELADAIKQGFEHVRDYYQKNTKSFDEGKLREQFESNIKAKLDQENVGEISTGDIKGITQAANEVRRQEVGLPEFEKTPQSFEQWNKEAEELLKNGYDVEELYKKLEAGHDATPVENAIRKIYIATLDAEIIKNPTDALLAKQKRATEIGDMVNRRAGQNLVSLKGEGSPLSTISDFYIAKMEANSVDILTEQQKKDTQAAYENYDKAKSIEQEKRDKAEEANSKLHADKEFKKVKSTVSRKSKKSHEAYVKDRQSIKEAMKDKWNKAANDGTLTAVPLPYVKQLIAISPDVSRLMKSYVEEGIDKLGDVIKSIHSDVKEVISEVTEKDIQDIIAGVYRKPKETEPQLRQILRDLQTEAKLLNELESLLNEETPKTEQKKINRNARIKELREKIREIKRQDADENVFAQEIFDADAKKLLSIKKRNQEAEAKIKDQIANKDFEVKKNVSFADNPEFKKKYPKLWEETMDAIIAKEDARHEFDIALLKDQQSKDSNLVKAGRAGGKFINTLKALVSGFDDSATGIQNLFAIAARPKIGGESIKAHFESGISQKTFDREIAAIHSSRWWPIMQKSGLDVSEPKSLIAKKKSDFFNNRYKLRATVKGKTIDIEKYLIAPFERMFTSLGNNTRTRAFIEFAEKWEREGITYDKNPKLFEDLARLLDNESGSGSMSERIQKGAELMSKGLWSPRLMASRLNILGFGELAGKGYYRNLSPEIRKMAAIDLAKFIATGGLMMWVFGLAGADTDLDPRSNTFGTVGVGHKRYNFWGGFTQYIKFFAQNATQSKVQNGNKVSFSSARTNTFEQAVRFGRGKLNPLAGTLADIASTKTYMGEPVTPGVVITNLVAPISVREVSINLKRDGAVMLFNHFLPSIEGQGVSDERDFKSSSSASGKGKPKPSKPKKQSKK